MKTLFLILFFTPFSLLGQEVFNSFLTETYPDIFYSDFEWIDRRIVFEPEEVTIVTETEQGQEIETLTIQEIHTKEENLLLLCQNRSKKKITISIPKQKELLFIDYYYQDSKGIDIQMRLHVEMNESLNEKSLFFRN